MEWNDQLLISILQFGDFFAWLRELMWHKIKVQLNHKNVSHNKIKKKNVHFLPVKKWVMSLTQPYKTDL